MIEKNNRMVPFLKLLMNHHDYMKSEDICNILHISGRTLRDDIVKFQDVFVKHGLHIESKHGTGYRFEIDDETKYHAFVAKLLKEEEDAQRLLPVYPEDRINYLIKRLLHQGNYIKLEDIADEMYISRSTIQNDMREVRDRLQFFHLQLMSKPGYGIRIEGDEMHKRSCISQYFFHTDTIDDLFTKRNDMTETQVQIRDILFATLDAMEFRLSDIGFQNLIIHISIALQRVNEKQEEGSNRYQELFSTLEYQVAKRLVASLNTCFDITLAPIEICYIAIHLMGKKTMQHHREFAITQEIEELLDCIFSEINTQFAYDFKNDFELYTVLALHFQPMLNRLRYGLSMQNPLLEDIKKENHQAFEMAIASASVIEKMIACAMSESEIGYLALHYALAITRAQMMKQKKKNIIVVCASGAGSSQILLYKIRHRFQNQLGKTLVMELYKLQNFDCSEYDVILSTVPISFATSIPVLQVQYFLAGEDIQQIQDALVTSQEFSQMETYFQERLFFTDVEGKTKEEVLQDMVQRTSSYEVLPNDFLSSVLKRENLSSTEFAHRLAMPHPMKAMCEKTFVAVGILKRPIKWSRKHVRFVFMMCVQKDSQEALQVFHETLSTFVSHRLYLQEFEKNPTYTTLYAILERLSKQVSTYVSNEDIFR